MENLMERCKNLADIIYNSILLKNLFIKNFTFKEYVKFFIFELLGQKNILL